MRFVFRVLYDALMRFSQDDGWAIASHIALSILTSLFPFLIFVTALAGFLGSKSLGDEGVQILFQTWPQQVATPIANEIHNVLTQTRRGCSRLALFSRSIFRRVVSKRSGSGLIVPMTSGIPGPGGFCGLNPSLMFSSVLSRF